MNFDFLSHKNDYNCYQCDEDSDDELDDVDSSSEDEAVEGLIRARFLADDEASSSLVPTAAINNGDAFERAMESQLSATVRSLERERICKEPSKSTSSSSYQAGASTSSAGSADAGKFASSKSHQNGDRPASPSNDDLLYDPDADDDDEKWVNQQRRGMLFPWEKTTKDSGISPQEMQGTKLPTSDAILNCPACMTLLCLDCQRHEIYETQYRAMFVKNCKVDREIKLKCPLKRRRDRRGRKRPREEGEGMLGEEKDDFNPVRCAVCKTEVGVYDSDEVFHFFNVIASFS